MLGYLPTTEDMRYETMRLMDLAWWQYSEELKDYILILHMEKENNPDKAEETIEKLLPGELPNNTDKVKLTVNVN